MSGTTTLGSAISPVDAQLARNQRLPGHHVRNTIFSKQTKRWNISRRGLQCGHGRREFGWPKRKRTGKVTTGPAGRIHDSETRGWINTSTVHRTTGRSLQRWKKLKGGEKVSHKLTTTGQQQQKVIYARKSEELEHRFREKKRNGTGMLEIHEKCKGPEVLTLMERRKEKGHSIQEHRKLGKQIWRRRAEHLQETKPAGAMGHIAGQHQRYENERSATGPTPRRSSQVSKQRASTLRASSRQ